MRDSEERERGEVQEGEDDASEESCIFENILRDRRHRRRLIEQHRQQLHHGEFCLFDQTLASSYCCWADETLFPQPTKSFLRPITNDRNPEPAVVKVGLRWPRF